MIIGTTLMTASLTQTGTRLMKKWPQKEKPPLPCRDSEGFPFLLWGGPYTGAPVDQCWYSAIPPVSSGFDSHQKLQRSQNLSALACTCCMSLVYLLPRGVWHPYTKIPHSTQRHFLARPDSRREGT